MIYIDPRAGSQKLIEKFPGECESMRLEFGDIAFWGNGPENEPWWVGIEYKQLEDVIGCIKSGRFTGTQLPGMMRMYNISFLLVEGIPRPDRNTGQLVRYRGKAIYGLGLRYSAFDNWLTEVTVHSSLHGKPCIVKMASTEFETVSMIRNLYNLYQKPWEDHTAMSRQDSTKMQRVAYDLEILKVDPSDPEYPKYVLRKQLFQYQGIGWDLAGKLSEFFGTMDRAVQARQKEWESFDGVGKTLAKRIYESLHGHADPEIKERKRKSERTVKEITND